MYASFDKAVLHTACSEMRTYASFDQVISRISTIVEVHWANGKQKVQKDYQSMAQQTGSHPSPTHTVITNLLSH